MSEAPDWRDDRIGSALRGSNPMVMLRMRSGFAVIGDTQFLPGYSILLNSDPEINHLTDLEPTMRSAFLLDMTLLGEAVQRACQANDLRRINYEILGNAMPELHAHVIPRYEWEPPHNRAREALSYGEELWFAPQHAFSETKHGALRRSITDHLAELDSALVLTARRRHCDRRTAAAGRLEAIVTASLIPGRGGLRVLVVRTACLRPRWPITAFDDTS